MIEIGDIPTLPDREKRIEEITVDCYGQFEELSGFGVYLTDALRFPFDATWRDPDEPGHAETVTVLGVADIDDRRGVLLQVRRGDVERRIVTEQVWAKDEAGTNAIVLDDYRYWVSKMYGLTPGFDR
jgi:hypothetical protein